VNGPELPDDPARTADPDWLNGLDDFIDHEYGRGENYAELHEDDDNAN